MEAKATTSQISDEERELRIQLAGARPRGSFLSGVSRAAESCARDNSDSDFFSQRR